MQIKIRRFRPSDAEECGKIAVENVIRLFFDVQAPVATWDYIEHYFPSGFLESSKENKRGREVWVAQNAKTKKIIGYVRFEKAKGKRYSGHIGNLFVKYGLRGKGVGKKLIKHAEERIKKKFNANKIQLFSVCIKPSLSFYKNQGYTTIGKIKRVGPKSLKKCEKTLAIKMEKKI